MDQLNITLGSFNNSFNFIFGLTGLPANFDIENNPYVQIQVYEMRFRLGSQNVETIVFEEKHFLEPCDQNYVDNIVETHNQYFF